MSIEKQQGIEVLGVDLSPSMSVNDRFAVHPHVMLKACLSLSWSNKSIAKPSSSTPSGTHSIRVRTLEDERLCRELTV
jgi:hypothetical protein